MLDFFDFKNIVILLLLYCACRKVFCNFAAELLIIKPITIKANEKRFTSNVVRRRYDAAGQHLMGTG